MSLPTPPRRPRALLSALLAAVLLLAAAHAAASAPAVYPLSEVKPGLAVEARTVFQGGQVETFKLETLGVLRRGAAMGSIVLARATEPRVAHTGIVAGMSGSPVYAADGRLVGAIAYAWSFSKDPICGITPIEEMLPVWDLESAGSPGDFGAGGPPARAGGESAEAGSPAALPRLRTPLAASGFAPEALRLLEPWARENGFVLTPGGAGEAPTAGSAPTDFARARALGGPAAPALAPGDAVAVDLLRGDATLAAIGTVTAVDGDRVLAFGHPFFLSGSTRLPMSRAEIVTVIPSLDNSFKLGTSVAPVGTLTEDRRSAVAGRLGPPPEMLPIEVRVRTPGEPEHVYRFQAAKQRHLVPLIFGAAAVNSVLARSGLPPESTWRWRLAASIRARAGQPARRLELSDIAPGSASPVFQALTSLVTGLLNNAWEPVDLDSLELALDVSPRIEEARVIAARLERPRVRPGETVRVEVDLESHRGPVHTMALEWRVPPETAAGKLTLFVGGGSDLARYEATQIPGRYRANSVAEMLRRLADLPKRSHLYLTAYAPTPEVALRGRDYPELPPSALRLLAGRQAADASARWGRASEVARIWRSSDGMVSGGTTLALEVSPRAPAASDLGPQGPSPQMQEPEDEKPDGSPDDEEGR